MQLFKHSILEEEFEHLTPAAQSMVTDISKAHFPERFVELAGEEDGKFPITDCTYTRGLCLLAGQVVNISRMGEENAVYPNVWERVPQIGGISLIYVLTGQESTSPFVYTTTFNTNVAIKPFYLDSNGDDDAGLYRGNQLCFKHGIYNIIAFLSGEWINSMRSQNFISGQLPLADDTQIEP